MSLLWMIIIFLIGLLCFVLGLYLYYTGKEPSSKNWAGAMLIVSGLVILIFTFALILNSMEESPEEAEEINQKQERIKNLNRGEFILLKDSTVCAILSVENGKVSVVSRLGSRPVSFYTQSLASKTWRVIRSEDMDAMSYVQASIKFFKQ